MEHMNIHRLKKKIFCGGASKMLAGHIKKSKLLEQLSLKEVMHKSPSGSVVRMKN